MNRIHRFGDNAEIDEKNRVKMYKKGSQWVTANQTSFMLLGKHALTKGLAITLGTVALGLTSGQAASADSVASTSSGTQPTTGETTNSSDSGSSNMVTLKSSVNTSEEDNGTTTSGNSNTDQAASTTVMTNFSASEALQANLASMSTTSSSLNTDSKSTTTTANEQSSDASSVIDNAGQNSKAQSGTITLSEMYKNDHLPDLQEKLYDGDRAVRTTEFHPDEIFDNTQVDYDQGTSTKTINNVWNQNYLNFNLNTYVSKELALGTPKDGLFYNLQIDDRLAKHITKIQITNSNKEVFNLSTRAEARKAGQNVGDYDDDVYCAEFNRVFPNTGIFSSETRTASGVIYFDGVIKDILSQATDNDFTKLPLGYRSYVSYEGNMPFTTTSLTHGNQTYPSKSILGASYTNGFFITPTQHIPDSAGKDDGMDGGYIGAPMFSGFVKNGIFAGGTDDVYYDVKNRAIIIDNYINRKSEFTYKNNGWKYDLKIDPRLLPFIKVEQTRDAQWNPVTSYGNVERIYFKNGTYSTHYTREEIRNQPKDTTADLIKETRKTYRDPQDGEFVADLNNVAPNVEKTRPWIIRTVLPLGEDSQGRLYTLTSILKSIFENTADSAKQPALQFQTYMDNGYGKMIEGTTSSNLSSFAELANSVSDNTEDQGLFVIDFVDENQTAQGAFTLEGKAGSTQEFTADFPDGWTFAGDPSKLPNGWTINSQGQLTGTATMQSFNSAQATWLLVKHGTYTVTHNAATQGKLVAKGGIIPGTTAKKFAQDINYTDLNKTLTRTVIIDDPHTGKQTTPQTVDFARDAIVDMVTGEIISYTPWQAVDPSTRNYDTEGKYNYYNNIPVPTVDGYTPSQTTIEKVYPNGTSDTNTSIEITYTANAGTQTINYQYEKADGSLVNVGTQVVNGKTDEKINKITWELPDGYALAEGVSLPSEVTIQATDTPITIKVDHLKVTVTHDKPQVAGALIPGTKDKHFGTGVTQDNLNHTVKRIINITYPDDTAAKQIVQEVKFVQDATVDAVTGEVTYTGWSNADTNTKFEALDSTALGLKSIDGYKPTKTSVAEAVPGGGDNDQTINISYTRNGDVSQTFTLIDVNDNAKEYTVTLSGTKGTTGAYKDISALLPSGMTFNDPNDESKTFKYVESGPAIQIRVKHQTQSQANDQKAVTREIILQLPDGTNKTETQSVSFERSVTRDLFNDHLTYGSWQNADPTKTGFEEYTPAPQAGYHPISTSESFKDGKVIAIDNVSVDTVYPAVTIIYAADDQSFKIIYQDEQGKVIQNDTIISGKTGTTVKINSTVPTGWKLADGQTVPSEFTFTTTAAKDQTYTIKHAVVTVSADNPKTINDQLPDNPAKKYPKGVDYDDLNKDVTRTIIINLPNGTVQTLKDTVAFTRSADVDEVDGTVKYNNWTSTNSNWNDRTSEIPDVAGYTKLYQDTDGKTLAESAVQSQAVNSDTPNSTVKVSYSADAQTVTVNYVDDQNNVIGHSSSLSGKTDKEMQIDKSQLNNLPENWIIDDSQTFPITFTPSSDASKNVVNVKVKHVTKVTINYLDDQNNETGYSSSLNGEAGTPMQITKEQLSIPDGWTVDDSQTLPITFTPDTDATKNVVNVKIKHLIVKVNNDNYYSGKLIPGTKAKHFGDYDLSHVVQRNIYIHYEKIGRGSSDLPAGSARFTREAWVDAVTGEIVSYEKWVSKGDSFGEYLLSNEGHGFDPSDIENFAKVYKVNGQFADSTVLDKVTPYVNEDGDIVTEVGGITVKNNDVNIDVDYLYLKNLSDVLNTVPATKQTYKYLNASSDKAKAYDTSVTDGQNLLKKLEDTSIVQTSTQADIDAAMNAITKAEAELDGKETNYKDLQKAVDDAPTNKQTDAYLNATDQKVYDKAVAAGDDILKAHTSGSIYSQADVDAAVKAIKDALNGPKTSYKDLQEAVADAPTNKQTEAYLNATDQKAYDDAVAAGQKILDEQKAGQAHSQTEVDAAVKAIKDALNGQATNYNDLQKAVNDAPTNKQTEAYLNATDQKAYDDAVAAGQKILDEQKAGQAHSQTEVDAAVKAIKDALNGQATNYNDLQKAVNDAPTNKQTEAYLNATDQKAYDDAVAAGQKILDEQKAGQAHSQTEVDAAVKAIKDALNGQATNYNDLQKAVNDAPTNKQTEAYLNATDQKAYDDAVAAGQKILDEQKAGQAHSQTEVDAAVKAIKDALNGQATNYNDLQKAVNDAPTNKQTEAYLNATDQKAYDDAVAAGQKILDEQKAGQAHSQTEVDAAVKAIKDALNGPKTSYKDLQEAVADAPTNKQTEAYLNATDQKAYDDAVAAGQKILDEQKAGQAHSQTEVDAAVKAIKDALNGQATDYNDLQKAVNDAPTNKQTEAYLNATDQKAYDDAVAAGQKILDEQKAGQAHSQTEVDAAVKAIKDALNGQATNYNDLQKAVDDAPDNRKTYEYINATDQKAYDDAVAAGEKLLDGKAHSQSDVNAAVAAINNALNGHPTDNTQLKKDVEQGTNTKQDIKYRNADPDKQKALDDAINHGQDVLNDPTADQKTVDQADQAIKDAMNDLNGQPTDKSELQKDINKGNQIKNTDAYKNADPDKQKALDDAIKYGQDVLDDQNADQKTVNNADQAIKDALKNLNGQATDKSQLQKDIGQGNQTKQDDKYRNADPDKQKSLDDAINHGQDVLNDQNADQKTVDQADQAIKDAMNDLNGQPTDKSELQKDVNKGNQTKNTDAYKNADSENQKTLDDSIKQGQDVLDDPTADQKKVDDADQAIKDALKNLNGQATDKSQLQNDVNQGNQTKQDDKYRNADPDKQKSLDDAINHGQDVLNDQNADQKTVDQADQAIKDAMNDLNGQPTDKSELQKDVNKGNQTKNTDAYKNADSENQKTLDDSIKQGQDVLDDPTADQKKVDDADQAIKDALKNLNGQATDKSQLQNDVNQGNQTKQDDKYRNADPDKQKSLDDAINHGQDVLNDQNADQKTVDQADQAIKDALKNLNGQATDKSQLQKDIDQGNQTKQDDKYRNADPDKQKALDDAIKYGQDVLNDPTADQKKVDDADQAIKDALKNLNGQATDKTQLQKDVDQGNQTKDDDSYKNADADKQKALDDAIKHGQDVLDDKNTDQKTVDDADRAIKDALKDLNGQVTDKSQLQKDVVLGNQTKNKDTYKNASQDAQKALDDAVNHGQDVLNDQNADQKTVDQADQAIKDALKNLNGQATDKTQLQQDINQGNQIKQDDKYQKADPDKQKALDDAVKYGQDILNDPTVDQKTVDDADQTIKDALNDLNGQATDKTQLQKDVNQGNQAKNDDSYKNADADKQKALDDAIKHGQDVLNDKNADQKAVDDADQAIKNALKDLNGQVTDKTQLQKDINQGNQIKQDDKYQKADPDKQKALDDAINYGEDVLNNKNADQKTVDDADRSIKDALKDLNGKATDKSQLQNDVDQASQTKQDDKYRNADPDKQKELDDAIKHGQDVLNDPTADQKTVDAADQAIKDAQKDLNGQATDKSQLQKDVDKGKQTKQTDAYKNASQAAQKALDDAVNYGEDVLNDQNADQKTVNDADHAITDALKNLNGETTDKSQLQKDVNQASQAKNTDTYKNTDSDKQKALDDAIKHGQEVLNDPTADQKTVDAADQAIKDAQKDLNGQATDKGQLQNDVNQANQIKNGDAYKNASQAAQKALDNAIKHGQDVLNDPNADQEAVDEAAAELEQAMKAIQGNDSEIPNDNGTNQNGNSQSAATATDSKSQNNDSTAIQAPNSQSSAENQKQNGQSNMQTLPQTGNQEGAWTVLTGLMATMLGSLGLMLGKKKGHDEEKN